MRYCARLGVSVALLLVAACSSADREVSREGTQQLNRAAAGGVAADAVSFRFESRGAGRADQLFARRGGDSIVSSAFADGGRTEIRRVGTVVYLLIDLELPTGERPRWLRVDPGADQLAWVSVLGVDAGSPSPAAVARDIADGVERVTDVNARGARQVLDVVPKPVRNGARPDAIAIRSRSGLFASRREQLYARGRVVAVRRYIDVRWGSRALKITPPADAVPVDGFTDPQADAFSPALRRVPTQLPLGWVLRSTVGLTPAQGSGTCQEIANVYGAPVPAALSTGYLATYLEPQGCAPLRQDGSADFVAGPNRGWIGTDPSTGATIGSLTVEGTAVRFRTSLSPAEAAVALARWRPVSGG